MQIDYHTYLENQNEYSIDSIVVRIIFLLFLLYFRNGFYVLYEKLSESHVKLPAWVFFYGFIFILSVSIFVEVNSNYLLYKSSSGGGREVEGVISGFKVEINEKQMRVESFYVNGVFFLHRSSKEKKGLFGYDNKKKSCTIIGDGTPVRISYVVDGKINIIFLIQTTIPDLC